MLEFHFLLGNATLQIVMRSSRLIPSSVAGQLYLAVVNCAAIEVGRETPGPWSQFFLLHT